MAQITPAMTRNLCYNCFAPRESLEGPCPYCGFDLAENEKKFPVALRAGTVLNDRYIVGRVLGQGGFGITYLAFDTQLQTKVAVKEYMPNDIATRIGGTTVSVAMETKADDFTYGAERFQEEARTLAKFIGHPNVAGVSSYFDENDTSYFVMDYIEGISFKSYIANAGGKVSVDEVLNVMIPVLRALTAVHAEGFIHRDVTPDNIYISKDGNVKLLDFGSARYSIGDKSKSLDVILKVGYAPKEQYTRRGRQGPYTDVYSCAACFYAALTGVLPPESLERLEEDTLVPVSQAGIDIPDWLDRAILKGLAVQPEDRFQSAAEFLDAIENQLLVDVPGAAPAEPPVKKKSRAPVIAAVAALLAVVLGIGIFAGRKGGNNAQPGEAPSLPDILTGNTAGSDDGLPPLKKAEVPSITIQGEEYSTDLRELNLADMAGLTNEDIESLQYMINLVHLTLPAQSDITDLTPLSGLTELRSLTYGYGANSGSGSVFAAVTDFSPLAGLTDLEELSVWAGEDADFSGLSGLAKLKALGLSGDFTTKDLTPLAGLTELENLSLQGNITAEDLNALSGLTKLQNLMIYGAASSSQRTLALQDLRFLSGMTRLQNLNLSLRSLESLEGLEPLTDLRSLDLLIDTCKASTLTLEPLSGMTKLQTARMFINSNSGSGSTGPALDAQALANLTSLTSLVMAGKAENMTLPSLDRLTKLKSLILDFWSEDGVLLDISGLSGLTELTNLSVNGVTDLTPLAGLTTLCSLHINSTSNSVLPGDAPSLEPLAGLTELTELSVSFRGDDWSIDAAPLKNLTKLQTLTLETHNNRQGANRKPSLYNLEALAELEDLLTLQLRVKNVDDVSPLGELKNLQRIAIYSAGDLRPDYSALEEALAYVPIKEFN